MFLDLKDSTSHAERLGHVKFGELIQDCFSDLTIIENRQAEVYQYVGDEAIIYWEVDRGLLNLNCIMAYFDYIEQLNYRKSYYLSKYGLTPEFKAGLNLGQVTVTEVGDIKRDLAFLGDTMNTAARIQALCNKYHENILISEVLNQQLPESSAVQTSLIDHLALKGKQESIGIFSVMLN
jgi:adenylate cyclase